ncbi:hypothetical protein [Halodesulfovibrio marinisediminis]|uniref:Uncharacterized protein n=1 Tax=Halodesulfovibrio marinisediminis DSM 17456 TaxID=1121457 RepID=A0A1N6GZ52_9BACT|nr:hypothetical protein [Halodesulfovibrio marinisediminis]SIO12789.1 hypothetical protein SAMN02745161_1904 [Halodesulfovibrio marinisediminis DSM 17456]
MHASLTSSKSFVDVLQEQIKDQQSKLLDQQQTVTVLPARAVVSPIVPEQEGMRTAEKVFQYSAGRESYGIHVAASTSGERLLITSSDEQNDLPKAAGNAAIKSTTSTIPPYMAALHPAFRAVI